MALKMLKPALALAFVGAYVSLVGAQVTSNATCLTQFQFFYNSQGQSPCVVAAYLGSACNGGQYDVSALQDGQHYIGPTPALVDNCQCSTVMYSMMAACSTCQNSTVINWSAWDASCSNVFVSIFPQNIPPETAVPAWAYQNVTTSNTFSAALAQSNTQPESTATNRQTTQTGTSGTATATSTSSSGKKSNAGAIAGGVVAGLVGLALIALLTVFLLRQKKKKDAARRGVGVVDPNMGPGPGSPFMMGQKGEDHHSGLYTPSTFVQPYSDSNGAISPFPHQESFVGQKPYNPDDPSTFPVSPAPPTLNSQYTGPNPSFTSGPQSHVTGPQGAYRGAPEV